MWWEDKAEKLMEAKGSSTWLKNALSALHRNDMETAIVDAEIVLDLVKRKAKEANERRNSTRGETNVLLHRKRLRNQGRKVPKIRG